MKKWKCSVCGYIHTGDEPPENCPVCGADKSKFVLLESTNDQPEHETDTNLTSEKESTSINDNNDTSKVFKNSFFGGKIIDQYPQLTQKMTKYHTHPVSVHIPNGVLPLSIFFTFIAAIFNSEAFATAASINMLFVFFSMPLVLFSGYVDWVNRFGGNLTKVFKIKIICGICVTVMTFLLTIWWMVQPDILLKESGSSALFLFINLLTLVPAIVAGFYGGKLVFLK